MCTDVRAEVTSKTLFVGTGREAGADEDDFHILRRKTAEVTRDETKEERRKKKADIKVAAHSGIVKSFGQAPVQAKKIVTF